jgi:hypothetical protein
LTTDYVATVNKFGGRISIALNHCDQSQIDLVTDVAKVTPIAKWFIMAQDIEKVMQAITVYGNAGLNMNIIRRGIKGGVIHEH